jgi:hypothetical protein
MLPQRSVRGGLRTEHATTATNTGSVIREPFGPADTDMRNRAGGADDPNGRQDTNAVHHSHRNHSREPSRRAKQNLTTSRGLVLTLRSVRAWPARPTRPGRPQQKLSEPTSTNAKPSGLLAARAARNTFVRRTAGPNGCVLGSGSSSRTRQTATHSSLGRSDSAPVHPSTRPDET